MNVDVNTALITRDPGPMFLNCPPMNGWGVDYWNDKAYVPYSYLGPLLVRMTSCPTYPHLSNRFMIVQKADEVSHNEY